jgi:hypothetical protein
MKKLLAVLMVAGLFGFAACGGSDKPAEDTTAVEDAQQGATDMMDNASDAVSDAGAAMSDAVDSTAAAVDDAAGAMTEEPAAEGDGAQ